MKFKPGDRVAPFGAFCKTNKRLVVMVAAVTVIIGVLLVIGQIERNGAYIEDENGLLTAIYRQQPEEQLTLPFRVEAKKGKTERKEGIILSLPGAEQKEQNRGEKPMSREELLGRTIAQIVKDLEKSQKEIIQLPNRLSDGTKLIWKRERDYKVVFLLFAGPAVLYFCYRSEKEKKKEEEKKRKEQILRYLPAFNNRLLLLLGSGMIFHDAFTSIARSSEAEKSSNALSSLLVTIYNEFKESGHSLTRILEQHARLLKMREFSRIVNIISDNQYKGVNLTEKLTAESDQLWDQRKKLAQEKGRIAETKLAFPLAMLLLVLVMVTAAPAVLQM